MDNTEKGRIGEEFVNNVAFNSFLKYWCYPNPLDILEDNKEICDLLVVFNSVCVIISVKNYSFSGNYERYFRKTTAKAIKQISGAERKLFRNSPILLKHPDRDATEFNKNEIKSVYRIIVNLNPLVKYYRTSHTVQGKNYTVMDGQAWFSALNELNTFPDFLEYLESRCSLFEKHSAFILPREEHDFSANDGNSLWSEIEHQDAIATILGTELDLIATYIINGFKFPEGLTKEKGLTMKIDGEWDKYQKSKLFEQKQEFEKESYFIDRLVREMIIQEKNGEKLSTMLYKLNRIQRSLFAKTYLDWHKKLTESEEKIVFNRTHFVSANLNLVFVYFIDTYPKEALNDFMVLSLLHHDYLHDFKCKEIGVIGVSKSFENFAFGYSGNEKNYPVDIINGLEIKFKELGWKLKE